jgi:hypothetical protein
MICFPKPVLREDLYVVKRKEFSVTAICAICKLDERPSKFTRDKTIFWSERMLHKDYHRKGSVGERISLVVCLKGLVAKTN